MDELPISNDGNRERYSVEEPITDEEIDQLRRDPSAQVLQTSGPLQLETWRRINSMLLAERPEIEVRAFGFYSVTCDLSFLELLTNMRRLSVDCIRGPVVGVDQLRNLGDLDSLCVGIWELQSFDFLRDVSPSLRRLSLLQTKSRKPELSLLERFSGLKTLFIESHKKNLDVISTLGELEDLTLRSVTVPGVEFLQPCRKLWSLDIKLGGTRDLSALAGSKLKYLELWQIHGFDDVGVVSELVHLQNLFLQSLPRIRELPSLNRLTSLRRIILDNMSGLRNFDALLHAPALEELAIISANKVEPADLQPVLSSGKLKRASAGLGSERRNDAFKKMTRAAGVEPLGRLSEFSYA